MRRISGARARSVQGAGRSRNAIAEWTVTILLLLFGTTTLVQAFVIPTPSMEDTLLVGDHLLVDKLAYAPSGAISKYIMPYQEPKHGDIIVFRYPVDISTNYVKRVIGVPGDHIKIVNKQVYRNGVPLNEKSYVYYKTPYPDYYRDNFPERSEREPDRQRSRHAAKPCRQRRGRGPSRLLFRDGRQPRQFRRQPLLGICSASEYHRETSDYLLVLCDRHPEPGGIVAANLSASLRRSGAALLH